MGGRFAAIAWLIVREGTGWRGTGGRIFTPGFGTVATRASLEEQDFLDSRLIREKPRAPSAEWRQFHHK